MSDQNPEKTFVKPEYPKSEITSRIIAAAQQVHRSLGPGFEELIYQRALALELAAKGLDFSREVWIDVHYKGQVIGKKRVDFVIEGVVLEIKARSQIEDLTVIQTPFYLKASRFKVGLLLNFGGKTLQIKRLIN